MGKISVLILEGEDALALKVLHSLAYSRQVKVYNLSAHRSRVHLSRLSTSFKLNSHKSDDARLEKLIEIARRFHIDVLAPIDEDGIRFVISHRRSLEKYFQIPPIPDRESFEIARDKWRFNEFAEKGDLPTPKSILAPNLVSDRAVVDLPLASLSYPVLLKPRIGEGGDGIERFDCVSDLLDALERRGESLAQEKYLIQEYVSSTDIDLSALCQDGKILAYTIQRPVAKPDGSFSYGRVIEFVKNSEVLEISQRLITALNWNGVAHIDLIRDEKTGRLSILEINPRYWGTLLGSTLAGVNFPYLSCLAAQGIAFPLPPYKDIAFAQLGGKETPLYSILDRKRMKGVSLKNTNLRFIMGDPLPAIAMLKESLHK